MSKTTETQLDEISRQLAVILRLLALTATASCGAIKDKAVTLHRAGMPPKEIAELLGSTPNAVSVALSAARRSNARRGRSHRKE